MESLLYIYMYIYKSHCDYCPGAQAKGGRWIDDAGAAAAALLLLRTAAAAGFRARLVEARPVKVPSNGVEELELLSGLDRPRCDPRPSQGARRRATSQGGVRAHRYRWRLGLPEQRLTSHGMHMRWRRWQLP